MAWFKIWWGAALLSSIGAAACSGNTQSAGAGGATAAGTGGAAATVTGGTSGAGAGGTSSNAAGAAAGGTSARGALGSPCVSASESDPNFSGFNAGDVNVETAAEDCSSQLCLLNHFRGRASCPYGQSAAAGGCFLPGSSAPVTVAVDPQYQSRKAAIASVCSCHCAGSGPGPYCTCSTGMDCVDLVPDLGLGGAASDLAGSYCIPSGSEFDLSAPAIDCAPPNCGPARPY